jgi:alkanesulfonate monooxygenase SsuD/methylene tetrahydromethanopterin reductase-like flavin-dependent oxidoreductase (luciferase family)
MLRFGIHLTNQHPRGTDMVQTLADQLTFLRFARDSGWDSAWAGQHFLSNQLSQLQPVPYLARLAAESGHMRLGLAAHLLGLLNPLAVAEEIATLDVITGGRLIYCIGLGYRQSEDDALGVSGSKIQRFVRNAEIVAALWRGETVSCDLPWCHLEDATLATLPVQRPRPPIWIGANTDAAVRRAARIGDAWIINPHAQTKAITTQLVLYREERERIGLVAPTEIPIIKEVYVGATREEAFRICQPHLEVKYKAYADWGQDKVLEHGDTFSSPFAKLASDRFIIGSPDDCVDEILRLRHCLGVTHLIMRMQTPGMSVPDALRSMRLFTDEVMPAVRASVP